MQMLHSLHFKNLLFIKKCYLDILVEKLKAKALQFEFQEETMIRYLYWTGNWTEMVSSYIFISLHIS